MIPPGLLVPIIGAISLVFAVILLLQYHSHSLTHSSRRRDNEVILVCGTSGSGKTRLWQALTEPVAHELKPTIPSLSVAWAPFCPALARTTIRDPLAPEERMRMFGNLRLVDTPGTFARDPKLLVCKPFVHKDTVAVVFCVDARKSTASQAQNENHAAYLFEILASPEFQRYRPALILMISHLQHPEARHRNYIREDLEREIERNFRHRVATDGQMKTAKVPIPYPTTFFRKIAFPLTKTLIKWRNDWRTQRKCRPIKLIKTDNNEFFRFSNIHCAQFAIAQETDEVSNVDYVRSFIMKTAAKFRR